MKSTEKSIACDVAVLGGGSAGYSAARTAAAAGLETVLIEGGREVGGLCILRGCMPSKALLYAGEVRHLAGMASTWGLKVPKVEFDFDKVMARKDRLIEEFASYRKNQLEDGGFRFVRAKARFLDEHTLELSDAESGNNILTSENFVIATGSVVSQLPLPGLAETGYITSDDALTMKRLPKSLIILGGGPVACELAQFFVRFDVKVTMIQRSPHILTEYDDDSGSVIEAVLRREGVTLHTDTSLRGASRSAGGKSVTFKWNDGETHVEADEILLCLGRTPNTASLGLEAIGVKLDGHRIITDGCMRSSLPHIFAAGDCTGPHEIVHIAVRQGEIAARNIACPQKPERINNRLLLSVVFTEPQLAAVGLTEIEAKKCGTPFLAASYPFRDHGKAMILGALDGFVKILAAPESGEIIGGACVGPMGGELIHEITAAMAKRMTVKELAEMPHYHPTLSEIWTYPAEELSGKIPRRPG